MFLIQFIIIDCILVCGLNPLNHQNLWPTLIRTSFLSGCKVLNPRHDPLRYLSKVNLVLCI